MNTRANDEMFNVDVDKAIKMVSNWDKCWQLQMEIDWDKCCHKENCDECDYMYGSGNCGEISNCLENIIEWLEELKEYRQNKADERRKTIDKFINLINEMPIYEDEYGEKMPMPIEMIAEEMLKENNQ